MTDTDLQYFREWVENYTKTFYLADEEDQRNIILKIEHTHNVCRNIVEIAVGEALTDYQVKIAEVIALFHDLGRFPQYAKYRTFRDADSVSHGRLGAQTLVQENILAGLPVSEQEVIIRAVNFHGAFAIPTTVNNETVFFLKLIRDADKVDIFRVFIEYYESPVEQRASATAFGVPDTPECSDAMLSRLHQKKIAAYSDIKNENDFRIMKLSWIYDMNFDSSIRLLQKRDYINRIIGKLPQTDEVRSAVAVLKKYISERLGNDGKN